MTTWTQLSRSLRAVILLPYLLVLIAATATPGGRSLWLDASNHPVGTVDFGSVNWTGDPTSGKAINPASIGAAASGSVTLIHTTNTANGVLVAPVNWSYSNAATLMLGDSSHYLRCVYGTGCTWYDSNQVVMQTPLVALAGNLTASGPFSCDDGAIYTDGAGELTINAYGAGGLNVGGTSIDGFGDISLGTSARIANLENTFLIDNLGNLTAVSGKISGSFGVWGVTGPTSRPATPTTQAQIIAILQAYGYCQ